MYVYLEQISFIVTATCDVPKQSVSLKTIKVMKAVTKQVYKCIIEVYIIIMLCKI